MAGIFFGSELDYRATVDFSTASLQAVSNRTRSRFGQQVILSPDTDGDGIRDLIFGGPEDDEAGDAAGAITPIPLPY